MATKFVDRYEVGDNFCGVIKYAPTKAEAQRLLKHYAFVHRDCRVKLYDRMAHPGRPELWDSVGKVLSIKATSP